MHRILSAATMICLLMPATSKPATAQRVTEQIFEHRFEMDLSIPMLPTAPLDTLTARAIREGAAAAGQTNPWGWFGRGFIGGLLGGPIGTAIAYRKAGEQAVTPPLPLDLATADRNDQLYLVSYSAGFSDRIRARRKGYALIGGAIGTGVLTYALLQLVDFGSKGGGTVIVPPPLPPGI